MRSVNQFRNILIALLPTLAGSVENDTEPIKKFIKNYLHFIIKNLTFST